ncbi:MAG: UDP-N-acetylmuramate dehydrogenase, partial [Bacteroidota bacterium]
MVSENVSLKPYNTFGISATAKRFAPFTCLDDLHEVLYDSHMPVANCPLILGGGSNILLTQDVDGLVLKNEIGGIDKIAETSDHVFVKAGAGVNWHQFVLHCIENNWAGIENLSLIPGCVGASPMQNIGAYGVEIKEVFHQLEAWDLQEKAVVTFDLEDCTFGYRESVFKNKYKGRFVILTVTFKLSKSPRFNTSYGAIEQELEKMGVQNLSIKAISDAVINIRSSKLPDPKQIGNAGSFFKNPEIASEKFETLKASFENIVGYPLANGRVKLAAGWLIEQCDPDKSGTSPEMIGASWKGYRQGDAGVHAKQA